MLLWNYHDSLEVANCLKLLHSTFKMVVDFMGSFPAKFVCILQDADGMDDGYLLFSTLFGSSHVEVCVTTYESNVVGSAAKWVPK